MLDIGQAIKRMRSRKRRLSTKVRSLGSYRLERIRDGAPVWGLTWVADLRLRCDAATALLFASLMPLPSVILYFLLSSPHGGAASQWSGHFLSLAEILGAFLAALFAVYVFAVEFNAHRLPDLEALMRRLYIHSGFQFDAGASLGVLLSFLALGLVAPFAEPSMPLLFMIASYVGFTVVASVSLGHIFRVLWSATSSIESQIATVLPTLAADAYDFRRREAELNAEFTKFCQDRSIEMSPYTAEFRSGMLASEDDASVLLRKPGVLADLDLKMLGVLFERAKAIWPKHACICNVQIGSECAGTAILFLKAQQQTSATPIDPSAGSVHAAKALQSARKIELERIANDAAIVTTEYARPISRLHEILSTLHESMEQCVNDDDPRALKTRLEILTNLIRSWAELKADVHIFYAAADARVRIFQSTFSWELSPLIRRSVELQRLECLNAIRSCLTDLLRLAIEREQMAFVTECVNLLTFVLIACDSGKQNPP